MTRAFSFLFTDRVGQPSRAVFALRAVVGAVFVLSGAIKFAFDSAGPVRFAKMGFSAPAEVSAFVGGVEILCGGLLLLGLFVRLAALPLIIDMLVAIAITKVPLLWGAGPEIPPGPVRSGLWAFAYQARLDLTLLVSCGYLVATGAGLLSLDAYLRRRHDARAVQKPSVSDGTGRRARPGRDEPVST